MNDITEKRVHGDEAGATDVFVAAGIGVVSVSVSAGRIGRFGVTHQCSPRDIAAGEGVLAVATDEDVLLREDGEFAATGFGPAVAVGIREGIVLAADGDGTIARFGRDGDAWTDVGTVDAGVLSIDGLLLATDARVYRIRTGSEDTSVRPAGLETAVDVAARGPYAATDEGLYALGNGWMRALEGPFEAVAAASREHACAAMRERSDASGGVFYERGEGGWRAIDLSIDQPVADVTLGTHAYAITGGGTLFAGPEWQSRSLGVDGIVGITTASSGSRM